MIKDLTKKYGVNWDEKIQIELNLADLQIIYDSIGSIPATYFIKKHIKSGFSNIVKNDFSSRLIAIYNELDDLITRYNGITDNDLDVNINLELEIVEEN